MRFSRKVLTVSVITIALVCAAIAVARSGPTAKQQNGNVEAAKAAALAHTRGGRVTEVEVSKRGGYEVDVILDNGQKVEIRLDADFKVTGQEIEDDDDDDNGNGAHDDDDDDDDAQEGPDGESEDD